MPAISSRKKYDPAQEKTVASALHKKADDVLGKQTLRSKGRTKNTREIPESLLKSRLPQQTITTEQTDLAMEGQTEPDRALKKTASQPQTQESKQSMPQYKDSILAKAAMNGFRPPTSEEKTTSFHPALANRLYRRKMAREKTYVESVNVSEDQGTNKSSAPDESINRGMLQRQSHIRFNNAREQTNKAQKTTSTTDISTTDIQETENIQETDSIAEGQTAVDTAQIKRDKAKQDLEAYVAQLLSSHTPQTERTAAANKRNTTELRGIESSDRLLMANNAILAYQSQMNGGAFPTISHHSQRKLEISHDNLSLYLQPIISSLCEQQGIPKARRPNLEYGIEGKLQQAGIKCIHSLYSPELPDLIKTPSGTLACLFQRGDEWVLAFPGVGGEYLNDLKKPVGAITQNIIGLNSKMYEEAAKLAEIISDIAKDNPSIRKVTAVGHSLGGSFAMQTAPHVDSVNVFQAFMPMHQKKDATVGNEHKITETLVRGDRITPRSRLWDLAKTHKVKTNPYNNFSKALLASTTGKDLDKKPLSHKAFASHLWLRVLESEFPNTDTVGTLLKKMEAHANAHNAYCDIAKSKGKPRYLLNSDLPIL